MHEDVVHIEDIDLLRPTQETQTKVTTLAAVANNCHHRLVVSALAPLSLLHMSPRMSTPEALTFTSHLPFAARAPPAKHLLLNPAQALLLLPHMLPMRSPTVVLALSSHLPFTAQAPPAEHLVIVSTQALVLRLPEISPMMFPTVVLTLLGHLSFHPHHLVNTRPLAILDKMASLGIPEVTTKSGVLGRESDTHLLRRLRVLLPDFATMMKIPAAPTMTDTQTLDAVRNLPATLATAMTVPECTANDHQPVTLVEKKTVVTMAEAQVTGVAHHLPSHLATTLAAAETTVMDLQDQLTIVSFAEDSGSMTIPKVDTLSEAPGAAHDLLLHLAAPLIDTPSNT